MNKKQLLSVMIGIALCGGAVYALRFAGPPKTPEEVARRAEMSRKFFGTKVSEAGLRPQKLPAPGIGSLVKYKGKMPILSEQERLQRKKDHQAFFKAQQLRNAGKDFSEYRAAANRHWERQCAGRRNALVETKGRWSIYCKQPNPYSL